MGVSERVRQMVRGRVGKRARLRRRLAGVPVASVDARPARAWRGPARRPGRPDEAGHVNDGSCVPRSGCSRRTSGQMTLELAVSMPVLIVVAVVAVNAMTFFHDCAVFDRVVHEAVRVHAASPGYGQSEGQSCALVQQEVASQLDAPNLTVTVEHGSVGAGFDAFTATLAYQPTLFGLGLRSQVFGVSLPALTHSTRYVVDCYKPGVVV